MAVLSDLGVGELRRVLIGRDVARLRKVKGVGPKSADRIALELADKVDRIPAPTLAGEVGAPVTGTVAVEEVHRALVVLGFLPKDAADALTKTAKPGVGPEELLRAALAVLR
jgi:Holliday junction DNA helicase RuvA